MSNNCISEPDTVIVDNTMSDVFAIIQPANDINCYATTVTLDGSQSSVGENIGYQWQTLQGNILGNSMTTDITQAGTFILLAIDTLTGCLGSDTIEIRDFIEYPGADAGDDQNLIDCEPDTTVVMGSSIASPAIITYSWRPFDGGNISGVIDERTIEVSAAGSYILGVLDTTNGCESFDTMQVFQNFETGEAFDDTYTIGKNGDLNANVFDNDEFSGEGTFRLLTNPINGNASIDSTNGNIVYNPNTDFIGEDAFEYIVCSTLCPDVCDTATVFLRIFDRDDVPNAFSPNGDGKNDFWVIPGIEDFEFRRATVVNRWGDIVFQSNEYNNDWGGTYKGNPLPEGTYYWILELQDGPEDQK
ncbi:MAG: gliding motility-associated C-terminal domain-containing protein, partial [Bacteroidota bacterium]